MPAYTWYMTSSLAGTAHQAMSETDPGTEAFASPVVGFVTGTLAATNYASFDAQTETSTFSGTAQPDGTIVTTANAGDCLRTVNTYSGTFDTANWTVNLCIRANTTAGGTSRGRVRIFSGRSENGSDAVERTAGAQVLSTVTPSTVTTTNSTGTFSVTGFSVVNEYIFVQIGWETVTSGGMTSNDENFRIGNSSSLGTRVVSANFTVSSPENLSILGVG